MGENMDAHETMKLWLENDAPVYFAAIRCIQDSHTIGQRLPGAAVQVRSLVAELFKFPGGYRILCMEMPKREFPNGYPCKPEYFNDVRKKMMDLGMDSVDWKRIVRDLNEDIDWD